MQTVGKEDRRLWVEFRRHDRASRRRLLDLGEDRYHGILFTSIACLVQVNQLRYGVRVRVGEVHMRKHRSVYQDHMNYVCNDIVKPFTVRIIHYAKSVLDMHDLAKYLPPPLMKRESAMSYNWRVCNKDFTISDIRLAIKDRLHKSMRGELMTTQSNIIP